MGSRREAQFLVRDRGFKLQGRRGERCIRNGMLRVMIDG